MARNLQSGKQPCFLDNYTIHGRPILSKLLILRWALLQRSPALDSSEAAKRARRRREHEAAVAARQRADLRRAVADIACEFEIASIEVRLGARTPDSAPGCALQALGIHTAQGAPVYKYLAGTQLTALRRPLFMLWCRCIPLNRRPSGVFHTPQPEPHSASMTPHGEAAGRLSWWPAQVVECSPNC